MLEDCWNSILTSCYKLLCDLNQDGAAVLGLGIAGLALAAAEITGNPIWDPIGSVIVGNLLGVVSFLNFSICLFQICSYILLLPVPCILGP